MSPSQHLLSLSPHRDPTPASGQSGGVLPDFFPVGAYQESLGDLYNLFGDTHAVHIRMDNSHYELE